MARGKAGALARQKAEARITKPMLYVKGWPLRMLTNSEADLLAGVRQEVCDALGFACGFLDRESIHARYAELLDAKQSRNLTEAA